MMNLISGHIYGEMETSLQKNATTCSLDLSQYTQQSNGYGNPIVRLNIKYSIGFYYMTD
jgi:hypothetical protein